MHGAETSWWTFLRRTWSAFGGKAGHEIIAHHVEMLARPSTISSRKFVPRFPWPSSRRHTFLDKFGVGGAKPFYWFDTPCSLFGRKRRPIGSKLVACSLFAPNTTFFPFTGILSVRRLTSSATARRHVPIGNGVCCRTFAHSPHATLSLCVHRRDGDQQNSHHCLQGNVPSMAQALAAWSFTRLCRASKSGTSLRSSQTTWASKMAEPSIREASRMITG